VYICIDDVLCFKAVYAVEELYRQYAVSI